MLSLFPGILFLSPFAATLFRIALAFVLGALAKKHFATASMPLRALAVFEGILGVLLFMGAYTQAAAAASALILLAALFVRPLQALPQSTLALAALIALSLVITGPGPVAFDLPL